ncbi:MAG: hypothetical protein QNJ72_23070 [Pleurocapsa sp. MO_226.B13]|nr:hypothetical protein [Pleurocapsa sp. MO_226.B13]
MSRQIRRLHRKKTDFTNFSPSEPSELSNSAESTEQGTEKDSSDVSSLQSQLTTSPSTVGKNDINTIRAELREDTYHSELAESDFTDETHDWGGDSQGLSDDYWHFVGSFE